ncbi:uncharacterized protein LOC124248794 [Equus quagga]|uniref:uncharacterized protein LOC124248794 n=1 Tax=Equus quagga TaxID=89248 RepID=UPI001EE2F35D|nr:uncharacterized protein LOC124248794 [Equus quagga]
MQPRRLPGNRDLGLQRRKLEREVYLTRSKLGWTGSRPASSPPPRSSALHREDQSFVLGDSSLSPFFPLITEQHRRVRTPFPRRARRPPAAPAGIGRPARPRPSAPASDTLGAWAAAAAPPRAVLLHPRWKGAARVGFCVCRAAQPRPGPRDPSGREAGSAVALRGETFITAREGDTAGGQAAGVFSSEFRPVPDQQPKRPGFPSWCSCEYCLLKSQD